MDRRLELRAGFTLAGRAMGAWGTPQFWKYVGWWHQEIHQDIPFDREVREMEKKLSECFSSTGVTSNVNISNCNFNIPVDIAQSPRLNISTCSTGSARIDCLQPGFKVVGSYHLPDVNLVLQASRKPGPMRRLVLKSLLGVHWADEKKKTVPPSEYVTRLLDELGGNP
jgi:hypothetical protein